MALPIVPVLKLIALGSIKLIFLAVGAVFFPVFALRFILGGASGMLLPTLDWLEEADRLDPDRHRAIVDDLNALSSIQFTRREARQQLLRLAGNTVSGFGKLLASPWRWFIKLFD